MSETPERKSVGIVILAAGASTRMGTPKQLLPHDATHTLLSHTIAASLASVCCPIVVVLGAFADQIRSQIESFPIQIVESNWRAGMSASICCGIQTLQATTPPTAAAVILLCDQPMISAAVINRLVATYRRDNPPIVVSAYAQTLGVPALFREDRFADLLSLNSSEGAKQVILRYAGEVVAVPFADGAIDLDTPQAYEQFRLSNPHLI